jgi:hypothetical protein
LENTFLISKFELNNYYSGKIYEGVMKRKNYLFLSLFVLSLLFHFSVASPLLAEVLINTFELSLADGHVLKYEDDRIAQSFQTSNNTNRINEVHLNLYQDGTSSGTFWVELWGFNTGTNEPSGFIVSIGSGNIGSLPTNPENTFSYTGLNISVNPNTNYYIVIRVGGSGYSGFSWGYHLADDFDYDTFFSYYIEEDDLWRTPTTDEANRMIVVGNSSSIPTLNEWGIISMIILFAGIGIWFVLRRNLLC